MSKFLRSTLLSGLLGVATLTPASAQIVSFQQGLDGYSGTVDTEFRSADSVFAQGSNLTISVDQSDGSTSDQNNRTQGAIKFENIFGNGTGQIPTDADILFAEVIVGVTSQTAADAEVTFNRVLGDDQVDPSDPTPRGRTPGPWREDDTWFLLGASVIPEVNPENPDVLILPVDPIEVGPSTTLAVGNEALAAADEPGSTETYDGALEPRFNTNNDELTSIAVTASVRAWQAGAPNLGWAINSTSGNGWDFATSEFDLDSFAVGDNTGLNLVSGVAVQLGLIEDEDDFATLTTEQVEELEIAVRPKLNVVIGVAGDLNFDGNIDALDYDVLRLNLGNENETRGINGDVDFDFDVDLTDFALFKEAFDGANGAGAFQLMVTGVPEPSAVGLLFVAISGTAVRRRRT